MPYIEAKVRNEFEKDDLINILIERLRDNPKPGNLNYVVTRLAVGQLNGKVGYGLISGVIAQLNDAAAEIRRRLLDPYEDTKKTEAGDVF